MQQIVVTGLLLAYGAIGVYVGRKVFWHHSFLSDVTMAFLWPLIVVLKFFFSR